jgi:hypothetical protein
MRVKSIFSHAYVDNSPHSITHYFSYFSRKILFYRDLKKYPVLLMHLGAPMYEIQRRNMCFLQKQKDAMWRTGASSKVKVFYECRRPPRCVLLDDSRKGTTGRGPCNQGGKSFPPETEYPPCGGYVGDFHIL